MICRSGRSLDNNSEQTTQALPLSECLAKTIDGRNGCLPGLSVEDHCKVVGLIAEKLITLFPAQLKDSLFPRGVELVSAVHDVGKINPVFQEKIHRSLQDYKNNSLIGLEYADPEIEKQIGFHSAISQAALYETKKYIPEIAGIHHGKAPNSVPLPTDNIIGGPVWQEQRIALINELKKFFNRDWPEIKNDLQATIISGLTTVSDWIGSGQLFNSLSQIEPMELSYVINIAVEKAGFVSPHIIRDLNFEDLFPEFSPRPIQKAFIAQVDRPGVYILEALMGEGKTEAALCAAYNMLVKGKANGIYFALPTQLTSEKIYERMNTFLSKILQTDDRHRALLLHSNAWLLHTDLGGDANPGYDWFNSRKRGILAPFAVGTIDQALMAVMNVKHGFVRAFGLAGKVVILDEVHTYDSYTGTIMDFLIHSLSALGCTVILLSATLAESRKLSMTLKNPLSHIRPLSIKYPLITKSINGEVLEIECEQTKPSYTVFVEFNTNCEITYELVKEKALNGEYIIWIENTVSEAQETYKNFAAWGRENNIEVGLLHSRYPQIKRKSLDDYWVTVFGKQGLPKRNGKFGKILIGTQVLEQSLDLDSDLLITRIAPTDMILQRIGRLWRHSETLRPISSQRKTIILIPEFEKVIKNPKRAFGSSGVVYDPYVLFRTLELWITKSQLNLPEDLRMLIEKTYEDRTESNEIAEVKKELLFKKEKLQSFANNSITKTGLAQSDSEMVLTRYSELPSVDVLLLKDETNIQKGKLVFFDGNSLELPKQEELKNSQIKKIAQKIMEYIISVPIYIAPLALRKSELSWLSPFLYISENEESRLRVAILDPSGKIRGFNGRDVQENYHLEYSQVLGYIDSKK